MSKKIRNWEEAVNNVKTLPNLIDVNDIEQVIFTRILGERFMEFDISKQMRAIEEKLTGKIRNGYTVSQIWDAYDFYKLKFEPNYV